MAAQASGNPRGPATRKTSSKLAAYPAPKMRQTGGRPEYKRQSFLVAAQRVRPQVNEESWHASGKPAVEGRAASEVAEELKLKLGALYTAKSRVLALIKKEIQSLVEE